MMPKLDSSNLLRKLCASITLERIATITFIGTALAVVFFGLPALAQPTKIPGTDASGQLEAAGTLLKIIDTGLFKWGARIFAGICIMSAGWSLKEQRFGIAIICVIGAIIFGTAPTWVKNIFSIGGGEGVFGSLPVTDAVKLALYAVKDLGGVFHA